MRRGMRDLVWVGIGHLHDGIILLLRPQSFLFFHSYSNLVVPARFE